MRSWRVHCDEHCRCRRRPFDWNGSDWSSFSSTTALQLSGISQGFLKSVIVPVIASTSFLSINSAKQSLAQTCSVWMRQWKNRHAEPTQAIACSNHVASGRAVGEGIAEPVPSAARSLSFRAGHCISQLSRKGSEFASASPRNRLAPRNDILRALRNSG